DHRVIREIIRQHAGFATVLLSIDEEAPRQEIGSVLSLQFADQREVKITDGIAAIVSNAKNDHRVRIMKIDCVGKESAPADDLYPLGFAHFPVLSFESVAKDPILLSI